MAIFSSACSRKPERRVGLVAGPDGDRAAVGPPDDAQLREPGEVAPDGLVGDAEDARRGPGRGRCRASRTRSAMTWRRSAGSICWRTAPPAIHRRVVGDSHRMRYPQNTTRDLDTDAPSRHHLRRSRYHRNSPHEILTDASDRTHGDSTMSEIGPQLLQAMYETALTIRRFEQRAIEQYRARQHPRLPAPLPGRGGDRGRRRSRRSSRTTTSSAPIAATATPSPRATTRGG